MLTALRTLARNAWSVLTHQRLAVVAIVVTGLASIPPEWFGGRWKVLAGVLTAIFATVAKGSMPVTDAIGRVENDAGWDGVPDKIERPEPPAPGTFTPVVTPAPPPAKDESPAPPPGTTVVHFITYRGGKWTEELKLVPAPPKKPRKRK